MKPVKYDAEKIGRWKEMAKPKELSSKLIDECRQIYADLFGEPLGDKGDKVLRTYLKSGGRIVLEINRTEGGFRVPFCVGVFSARRMIRAELTVSNVYLYREFNRLRDNPKAMMKTKRRYLKIKLDLATSTKM